MSLKHPMFQRLFSTISSHKEGKRSKLKLVVKLKQGYAGSSPAPGTIEPIAPVAYLVGEVQLALLCRGGGIGRHTHVK